MKTHPRWLIALSIAVMITALSARASDRAVKGSFERTLNVTGPVDLDVHTGSGDIVVRAGNSSAVEIHGKIQAREDGSDGAQDAEQKVHELEAHPPIEQDGNHIRIGQMEDRDLGRNVSIDYEITVPEQTQLTTGTGSGDLTVEGIRGPVEAHTGSGNMKFHAINGSVRVRSGSGDAKFEQIAGERVEIETGSGDMELRDLKCALSARTGSGNITAEGEPAGDWTLQASSGEVTVRLPSQTGFDLVAHTSSGEIKTELPIIMQGALGRGELRGKVRGGGVRLEISTGSGDIHIE